MKNNNKTIIITVIAAIIVALITVTGIVHVSRKNKSLTVSEKKWLDQARLTNQVININVLNNASVFGSNGTGLYYDFLDSFSKKYDLNINEVTINYGTISSSSVSLTAKTSINDNDTVLYKDHYVLISKDYKVIDSLNELQNGTVGILANDLSYVTGFINASLISYTTYDTTEDLFNSFATNDYLLIPLHLYLDKILQNNYKVIYHFSDIYMYYVLSTSNDTLSSVIKKYYNSWKSSFDKVYNENLFELMTKKLGISSTEIDAMRSVTYEYGYINNSPYEVISSGNYGGIASIYLREFTSICDIDVHYKKYGNYNKFAKAISKNKVDIYFGVNDLNTDFNKTSGGIQANYVVVANISNDLVVNSINSLVGKTVYVDKNSIFNNYVKNIQGINLKYYNDAKELVKLNKKDVIILLDKNIFDYYKLHGLEKYSIRYEGSTNSEYNFYVKQNTAVYKLFDEYMNITDAKLILNKGIYNHEKIMKSSIILSVIAKYFVYILFAAIILAYVLIRKSRKIHIAKRIKKEDKIRFIDELTMLKNRNYLKENIDKWSNNTIYPQAIVVVDLNHVQAINDVEGYEEGDKQIKGAANALIKTQLDNSDIIRTDGNEFVIYLVGYSQKQITNYIHKLNKEFKKLPYNYGAEFGYSLIIDDIKTIEDALNEATKSLKEQKELNEKKI